MKPLVEPLAKEPDGSSYLYNLLGFYLPSSEFSPIPVCHIEEET